MADAVESIVCASYTHARRHPMVLGRIAGWTPPFQLTVTQLVTLLVSFLALLWTAGLWSRFAPGTLQAVVLLGVPIGITWSVRRVRVEGRSLARAGLGWLMLWSSPRTGTNRGRPVSYRRPASTRTGRLYVAGDPR